MKVKDVMTQAVETVSPDATVSAVAELMTNHGIGFVPVLEADAVVGVVTDRDIALGIAGKVVDAATTPVCQIMTRDVVYCFDDEDVTEAARLMARKHVRRLLVVDRNDRLAGVVSLDDLARDTGDAEIGGHVLEQLARTPKKAGPPFSHIVAALDGSKTSEAVLPYVEALAGRLDSQITLIRAITPLQAVFLGESLAGSRTATVTAVKETPITEEMRLDAVKYLTAIRGRLERRGFTVDCEYPEDAHPARAIVRRANHLGADLIAMTTHGRTGLGRAVLGSVTDEVLRTASCPVMAVHRS